MREPAFLVYAAMVVGGIILALAGLYLLANYNRLLKRSVRNEWLRKNIVVSLIIFCFTMALSPLGGSFFNSVRQYGLLWALVGQCVIISLYTLFVFNAAWWVAQNKRLLRLSFVQHKLLVLLTITVMAIMVNVIIKMIIDPTAEYSLKYNILISSYFGVATGAVYIFMSYLNLERQRKFDEKELELSRLRELKSKAELDALHSKVNPHFLYNALNSIADLSLTDGKKARKMTIALADLFRYSINYSHDNYSTVEDEMAMTETYLQIEKIRFEDRLTYSIHVADDVQQYLIPRFLLQPLAENAVKHGLKATGRETKIDLLVKKEEKELVITVADNGPSFPADLVPGYGVKSVFDKLDLLFPGCYSIHFINEPVKQVSIRIQVKERY